MRAPARCQRCGLQFVANLPFAGRAITISGSFTNCPRCGSIAKIYDGTYHVVERVLSAARAPGVIRDDVLAFQAVAQSVQSGTISREEATKRVDEIGASFSALWAWINANGAALALLISILTILIAFYYGQSANEASTQQHIDAQDQTRAIETQTQAIWNDQQAQQKIYEELLKMLTAGQEDAAPRHSRQGTPTTNQEQTPKNATSEPNRHERRKAAKLSKRPKSGS